MIKMFENYSREEDIKRICRIYRIMKYTINSDFSIDVDETVNIRHKRLTELPLVFNRVNGDFICEHNLLTTLKGSPRIVNGNFICKNNKLTDLKGCPERVNGDFICVDNHLYTLNGSPKYISGNFYCNRNRLGSLEYFPNYVGGEFHFIGNNLPKEILDFKDIKILLKYQKEFGLWIGKKINKDRWNIFIDEYDQGNLK